MFASHSQVIHRTVALLNYNQVILGMVAFLNHNEAIHRTVTLLTTEVQERACRKHNIPTHNPPYLIKEH